MMTAVDAIVVYVNMAVHGTTSSLLVQLFCSTISMTSISLSGIFSNTRLCMMTTVDTIAGYFETTLSGVTSSTVV